MRIALLALCCAGCLSTPPAAPDDGRTFDASPVDAGPCDRDPQPGLCNPTGDFTAQAFPGTSPFELRSAHVADLNGDGDDDLILTSNAADNQGIFVLLGPVDRVTPRYHAFIAADLEVGGLAIRNVRGPSACPELTVLGLSSDRVGLLKIWSYSGARGVMYDPTPQVRTVDFPPEILDEVDGASLPVLVTWARLRAEGDDLLLADRNDMRVIRFGGDLADIERPAEIETVQHILASQTLVWDSINGIVAAPVGDCSIDQVLVTEGDHGHKLVGAATIGGGAKLNTAGALGSARADLDGTPPADVVVAGADELSAYLLVEDAGAAVEVVEGATGYSPLGDSGKIDGFAVGQLGGGVAPEWVAIDVPDGAATGMPRAILVDALAITGDPPARALDGSAPRTRNFTDGFIPRAVLIADLASDLTGDQIWTVASDGVLRCLVREADGGLGECP